MREMKRAHMAPVSAACVKVTEWSLLPKVCLRCIIFKMIPTLKWGEKKKAPGIQLLRKGSFPHSSSGSECVESTKGYLRKTEPFFHFLQELCCPDGWRLWREGWWRRRSDGCDARTDGEQVKRYLFFFFHLLIIYLFCFIHISISWRNRKDFFFPLRKPQMSLEIPGTTGQVPEGSVTVVVSFVWYLLMFTCRGFEGIGLIFLSAPT